MYLVSNLESSCGAARTDHRWLFLHLARSMAQSWSSRVDLSATTWDTDVLIVDEASRLVEVGWGRIDLALSLRLLPGDCNKFGTPNAKSFLENVPAQG